MRLVINNFYLKYFVYGSISLVLLTAILYLPVLFVWTNREMHKFPKSPYLSSATNGVTVRYSDFMRSNAYLYDALMRLHARIHGYYFYTTFANLSYKEAYFLENKISLSDR